MPAAFDLAIVGAGIVGLATGLRALARRPGLRLIVLDKEAGVARHQSGRNSNVIHSGVFCRPGSMKAGLCVRGAALMVDFCRRHRIPLKATGKLIVAARPEEIEALHELHRRGTANGVAGLQLIDSAQIGRIEPLAAGLAALRVPSAAVTDFPLVCQVMADLIRQAGGEIRLGARVVGLALRAGEVIVRTSEGDLRARSLVNCAGLHADRIARMSGASPGVTIVPFRGEYYDLRPEAAARLAGMIYPVPDPALPFLGVHLTPAPGGGARAGPNAVPALSREGYAWSDVSPREIAAALASRGVLRLMARHWRAGLAEIHRSVSRRAFLSALRRIAPGLREGDLIAGAGGVRAQAVDRDGRLVDDFHIVRDGPLVHVLNAPSPAATASLAIGDHLAGMALEGLQPPPAAP